MEYKDIVRDFAERTKINLAIIQSEVRAGRDAYEVTQLINSLLGLLVFPEQAFFKKIPEIKINDLKKQGWPIPLMCENYSQVADLKQLVRYLRNGIAHFNLRFTDKDGHVDGLIIWNIKDGLKDWEAEFKIEQLKSIIERFSELLLK